MDAKCQFETAVLAVLLDSYQSHVTCHNGASSLFISAASRSVVTSVRRVSDVDDSKVESTWLVRCWSKATRHGDSGRCEAPSSKLVRWDQKTKASRE
jgi:hypothetical protein